jgi:hypothetical protein
MDKAIEPIESTSRKLDKQINRDDLLTRKYYFDHDMALTALDVLVQSRVPPEVIQTAFEALGVNVPAERCGERLMRSFNDAVPWIPESVIVAGLLVAFLALCGLAAFIGSGVWIKWIFG